MRHELVRETTNDELLRELEEAVQACKDKEALGADDAELLDDEPPVDTASTKRSRKQTTRYEPSTWYVATVDSSSASGPSIV